MRKLSAILSFNNFNLFSFVGTPQNFFVVNSPNYLQFLCVFA